MPARWVADECKVSQLVETRWTRYGKDLVYVRTDAGDELGHFDLKNRTVTAQSASDEQTLQNCLQRWTDGPGLPARPTTIDVVDRNDQEASPDSQGAGRAEPERPTEPVVTEAAPDEPLPTPAPRDLTANVAGAAAWAERNRINSQAPLRNFIARLRGVKTDERAWRVGAKGEEKVARVLGKLGPGWRILHAVAVGDQGSDIDHVVVGPPGVITLNTKHHPDGKVWVADRMVMVNGQKTQYLHNSRFEAKRATHLLSSAYGRDVHVQAALVFVGLDDYTVKAMPSDIGVVTRFGLLDWLRSLPAVVDPDQAEEIFQIAKWSTTWTTESSSHSE